MNGSEILENIIQAIESHKNHDGWTELSQIAKPLNDLGVNFKELGFLKFRELFEEYPDNFEIKKEFINMAPIYYVKQKTPPDPNRKILSLQNGNIYFNIRHWAWMGDFRQVLSELENIALKERWYYKNQNPVFPFPILSKYFTYTFFRLGKEKGKILITDKYAAFNTGLVNNDFEPIYALFEKNNMPGKQEWYFCSFCFPGVDKAGKILVSNFFPLPEKAKFFRNPAELFYYSLSPEPQLNWNHIILENVQRIPVEILEDNKPWDFILQDTNSMSIVEKNQYYQSLADSIENDPKKFRSLKNRFSDSLSMAMKRVQWNFRTAVPMYYPTLNRTSFLLPLSLTDNENVDLALVVERMPAGSYLGRTILPLCWAYNSARLINRPDSDWLIPEIIESVNNEFGNIEGDTFNEMHEVNV